MRPGAVALLVLVGGAACVPDGPRREPGSRPAVAAYLSLLDAEDARPREGAALEALLTGTRLEDPRLRRIAVRALGRLENPALVDTLAVHVADPDPAVRAAAVDAVAQSVHGTDGAAALEHLLARAAVEQHPTVRGALGEVIGRLATGVRARVRAEEALASLGLAGGADAPRETLLGVAMGFDALVRGSEGAGLGRSAADRLLAMAAYQAEDSTSVEAGRIRALAYSALGPTRRLTLASIERGLHDPDPEVRRTALRYLGAVVPSRRGELLRAALDDPSPRVVIDALRLVAAGPRDEERCGWLVEAASAESPTAARIVALEALARPCPGASQGIELRRTAAELPDEGGVWQPAAQALLSLTRIDRVEVAELLPRFAAHPSPFVRAYAARAAGAVGDDELLRALAADPSPNVRTAALEALFADHGHALDGLLLDQLADDDPQLVLTVARLLEGSPLGAAVASAALSAFERISAARRETWRDPRVALLARVGELGDASLAPRLEPFVSDYDPVIARDAADLVGRWTGRPRDPTPAPIPRAPLPTLQELDALEETSVALHMRGGGVIVIDLLPELAPRNVARFVTLARTGYFDGLTFHRWVPNFVIQGGSPGANEYQGDGPYTRDEVGGAHWRGTVGVSTRGRDTGDGQIFVNLVDNLRLDHDYTVFGVVSEGLDVVDGVLEGAVIERAEVRADPR